MQTAQLSNPAGAAPATTYGAPHCDSRGPARGLLFHPDGFSLWSVVGELDRGAVLEWGADHGDEAVYVVSGGLDCADGRVTAGSTLIIEAGVPTAVRSSEFTRLVHVGPISPASPAEGILGPADGDGRGIHVVTAHDASKIHFGGRDNATSVYFRDGTCPTCRITFFLYDGSVFTDGYVGVSHTHSEDEIMHVLEGELHVGPLVVGPGTSIAVPRSLRYSFRTEGPFRYLNYRADVSIAVVRPGSDPVLETVANLATLGAGA
jgi:mannose-6-phosphate isomerase-like protein (cupin superfamily)